ncbi:preprotein translocase subunit SecG [Devosia sp.]|uniref:preprotein translocase subunit SecG n=1 Tax=Devosia sp. TaxID=1871048 RepID=UPI003A925B19
MANILIVAYLLIVLALIAVILIQRSEGGGLGMGSSNSNGLVSARGSANLLTRTTAILAALFFATAIGLTILAEIDRGTSSILDQVGTDGESPTTVLDAMEQLQQQSTDDLPVPAAAEPDALPVPDETAPAETAPQTTSDEVSADPGLAVPEAAPPASTDISDAPATTEAPTTTDSAAPAESDTTNRPAAPSN